MNKRIDDGVLRWFVHTENYKIAKRVNEGVRAGSHSVGRQRKSCFDTAKNCLKKRGLDVRQVTIIPQNILSS